MLYVKTLSVDNVVASAKFLLASIMFAASVCTGNVQAAKIFAAETVLAFCDTSSQGNCYDVCIRPP